VVAGGGGGGVDAASTVGVRGAAASFDEMVRFMREERQHMEAKMDQQQKEFKHELQQLRKETKTQLARDAITEERLGALQSRLEALREARLLADEDLFDLEDAIVDCIQVLPTALATDTTVDKVVKMILISERVTNDKTLARQFKRKKFA
jgi:uncharacterized circularly permuted ATP-grasp superfamily protein